MLNRLCPSFLPHVALLVGIKLHNIAYITPYQPYFFYCTQSANRYMHRLFS